MAVLQAQPHIGWPQLPSLNPPKLRFDCASACNGILRTQLSTSELACVALLVVYVSTWASGWPFQSLFQAVALAINSSCGIAATLNLVPNPHSGRILPKNGPCQALLLHPCLSQAPSAHTQAFISRVTHWRNPISGLVNYGVLNNIVTFFTSCAIVRLWETQQEFGETFRHWSSGAYGGRGYWGTESLSPKWHGRSRCIGSRSVAGHNNWR